MRYVSTHRLLLVIWVLLAFGFGSSRATATPLLVYDNGALTGDGIGIEVFYGLGDDFRLATDTVLTHVEAPAQIETWMILTGWNDLSPNDLLASGPVEFEPGTHRFSVGAIPLKANETYWIAGINGNLDECDGFTGGASWELAAPNTTMTAREFQHSLGQCPPPGEGSGWDFTDVYWSHIYFDVNENYQLAFQLYGEPVPEPVSILLFAVGGVGLVKRFRRQKGPNA